MSYPNVIHAKELRQGDRVHTARASVTRRVLATCWKPGWSFIHILVEGDNEQRSLGIGEPVAVIREGNYG